VTVFPGNATCSLPAVHGTYVLLDAATGVPAAVLDGTALTLRRTAAASALAASYLARPDSAVHLMVGTGALAPHLIVAHSGVRPIRQSLVWGRDAKKAAALAARLAAAGIAATPVADLAAAAGTADIVTCATLAREPLIRGAWLKPGAHLDLVGGYTPEMREADDDAVVCARVYVDTEAALQEAGDVVQPLLSGVLERERSPATCLNSAGISSPVGAMQPRLHCSNRSARRSKISPPPALPSAASRIEHGEKHEPTADRRLSVRQGPLRDHRGTAIRLHLPLPDCQRLTSSAFSLGVVVPEQGFRLSGVEPRRLERTADSGRVNVRLVCPECGSWICGLPRDGMIRLRGGSLDDTSWLRPTRHIWIRRKQTWVTIPQEDEVFEGQG
jgi:hypothetical protein